MCCFLCRRSDRFWWNCKDDRQAIIFWATLNIVNFSQLEAYYNGQWTGDVGVSGQNVECNFHLARILEYLECPQYLRKALFSVQKPLKFAGVLNPLDGMHHLRANDLHIQYREGVVVDKPIKKGHGSFCDVGLDKVKVLILLNEFDTIPCISCIFNFERFL